jgi:hypothetical protein
MRKDMPKVIVERPRRGSVKRARVGRTVALEDEDGEPLRARAPARKPAKTKSLNENLAPLKRYLNSQVGRPWSKVYAEIAEHLKPSNTVQQHVRDHVEDFVATKTRMEKGKVMVLSKFSGLHPLENDYHKLYVHPRTGLLRRNDKSISWKESRRRAAAAKEAEQVARMRVLGPKLQLHLLDDGCWWEVKIGKLPALPGGKTAEQVDVVRRAGLSRRPLDELYGRHGVIAMDKRLLSKADKKKHGL